MAASAPHHTPVLLTKTKSTPADSYEEYFSNEPFTCTFVPVLEHRSNPQNLNHIRSLLLERRLGRGRNAAYGGMIFTSQRAVEGFAKVVGEIEKADSSHHQTGNTNPNLVSASSTVCSSASSIHSHIGSLMLALSYRLT